MLRTATPLEIGVNLAEATEAGPVDGKIQAHVITAVY